MAFARKELPLKLGQKCTASIRGDRYDVIIRGWSPRHYIITDAPQVSGSPIKVAPNTGCSINFMQDGKTIDFKTNISYINTISFPLMILEYPSKFDAFSLRKNDRLKTNFPVSYSLAINNTVINDTGTLRDLSFTGFLISHKKTLQKKNKILINVNLGTGALENMEVLVKNIRHNPKNLKEPKVTGVSIINLSDANRKILQEFMEIRVGDRRNGNRM